MIWVKHLYIRPAPCGVSLLLALVGIFVLANFPGCGKPKSSGSIAFQKFVNSHPLLHSPPSHRFRFIHRNQSQREKVSLIWGDCDGFYSVFKVKNGIELTNLSGGTSSNEFKLEEPDLSKLKDWKECDWINGRNEQYGFGVRPDDQGFAFNGVQASAKQVVTPSSLPFALVGVKCFIRDVESEFEIIDFLASETQFFPDSMALKLLHRAKNYSTTVFLNRNYGNCTGYESFDADGKMTGRTLNHYRMISGQPVPLAQEVFFTAENGAIELSRSTVFLEWELSDELSYEQCAVSHYGFPEPEFSKISNRHWMVWLVGSFAIISIGFIVFRKLKKR